MKAGNKERWKEGRNNEGKNKKEETVKGKNGERREARMEQGMNLVVAV